jgi:hypothetical protein
MGREGTWIWFGVKRLEIGKNKGLDKGVFRHTVAGPRT